MKEVIMAPKYREVAARLRERITSGELAPGDPMPTESATVAEFGVSLNVARNAFAELTSEGLVTPGGGRAGRRVRAFRPLRWELTSFERAAVRRDDPATGTDDWSAAVIAQGRAPRQEVSVTITPAPAGIADHLEIEAGQMAVRRHRRRLVDEEPAQLSDSWFPEGLARGTVLMEERDVAMAGGIMKSIGHPQVRVHDEIRVRMPSPDEADELHLITGTPVGQHTRVGIGADNVPVRVMVTVFGADRTYLTYELDV